MRNKFLPFLHVFCFIIVFHTSLSAQQSAFTFDPEQKRKARFMFYNVENAFDTLDNPHTRDDEYLPGGVRNWNVYKYYQKIQSIYKVTVAAGGWEPPELIGLCEIENAGILKEITHNTPLSKYEYKIIHEESPDHRGIDVALLYKTKRFTPLKTEQINIQLPEEYSPTRNILYVKGTIDQQDTIHIFINHWPSKWGGETETDPKRNQAARVLRKKTDSIFHYHKNAKIIITGDFNDEPEKQSLSKHLGAKKPGGAVNPNRLYNLSWRWKEKGMGTHKYQGRWSVLDQFIVSGALLVKESGISTSEKKAFIFNHPALLTKDEKHMGRKPYRTFSGYKYLGGFSDHLPVIIDLN